MRHGSRRRAAAVALAAAICLAAAGCSRADTAEEAEGASDAVTLEPVAGTELSKVILTPEAVERLGIRTGQVRVERVARRRGTAAASRKVVPHAAVLYDEHGDTWAFTSPEPLTFVRRRIEVDRIEGGRAVLKDGPAAGTTVVTVGAAELLGAELGVGE
jgi:multidrug efflux pump subunit AcrA (membrane-fusion protein)